MKPVLRRQMEVYAGFLEYTDHHVGRLFDGLKKLGIFDDTHIYYIVGDNGASAEGTLVGAYNEMANFNGLASLETPQFLMERLDKLGGPESYNHEGPRQGDARQASRATASLADPVAAVQLAMARQ